MDRAERSEISANETFSGNRGLTVEEALLFEVGRAEVTGVAERRVTFRVEAWDEKEKIGEGTHERAIINVAKFATKLAEKMQRKPV